MIELVELQLNLENTIYHFLINKQLLSDDFITTLIKIRNGHVINPLPPYKARVDKAHGSHGQKHIHIYKNGDVIVINKDGTQRHRKNIVFIPKKLWEWLRKNFPDFNIPERIIKFGVLPDHRLKLTLVFDL